MSRLVAVTLAASLAMVVALACSGSTDETNPSGAADAGDAGPGGGGCTSNCGGADAGPADAEAPDASEALSVQGGIQWREALFATQGGVVVQGGFVVQKAGQDVTDAELKVNGVTVPYDTTWGQYSVSWTQANGVAPGQKVTLEVKVGSDQLTSDFTCSSTAITSPTEGTALTPGTSMTATWGPLGTGLQGQADLRLDYYVAASNEGDLVGGVKKTLALTDSSATLTVPPKKLDTETYVLTLKWPGTPTFSHDPVKDQTVVAGCGVERRVHLGRQ